MIPIQFRRRGLHLSAALLFSTLAACGGGDGPTQPPGPTGVAVVAGGNMADSVAAQPLQPLLVEVRDTKGKLAAGVQVRFESTLALLNGTNVPLATFAAAAAGPYESVLAMVTDAAGHATAFTRLGNAAGTGTINVTVPALGFSATTPVTVRAGNAARLVALPRDTAVYVGGSYTLRTQVLDRLGNAATGVVTGAPDSARVTFSGGAVTGTGFGRVLLRLAAGSATDSVRVSVVPQGTMLAAGRGGIYTFGLDGSGYRRVVASPTARSPRWFPGGAQFVYGEALSHALVSDLNGVTHPLLPNPGTLTGEVWPHPSRDGQWVYFGGYTPLDGQAYRVKPDGSGLSLVPGVPVTSSTQAHPTVSPQNDRVVYFLDEFTVTLHVRNMQTGAELNAPTAGHAPEWSHGELIAFIDPINYSAGRVRVMAPNGSGNRAIAPGTGYDFGIDWSPDDQWVAVHDAASGLLHVIEVASGRVIPIPFTQGLADPAWR
ncbi:MAG TPA: hypothetical protein VFJ16_31745 [Longimicrobium sp.]|nr:hypothetical protein [Longimicrobium sp.]